MILEPPPLSKALAVSRQLPCFYKSQTCLLQIGVFKRRNRAPPTMPPSNGTFGPGRDAKVEMARDQSGNLTTRAGVTSSHTVTASKHGATAPARPNGPMPLTNRFIRKALPGMPQTNFFTLRKLLLHRWEFVTSELGESGKDFHFVESGWIWNTAVKTKNGQFLAIKFAHDGSHKAQEHGPSVPVTRLKKSPVPHRFKDAVNVGNHCLTRLSVRMSSQLSPDRCMVEQRVRAAISTQEPLQTTFYKGEGWAGKQWLLLLPVNGVAVLRIDEDCEAVFVATILSPEQAHVLAMTANPPQYKRWTNTSKAVVG